MIDKCSKCFIERENMECRIEGGIIYKFCPLCAHILERDGRSFNLQWSYLQDDQGDVKITPVEKSMIEARIKRAAKHN